MLQGTVFKPLTKEGNYGGQTFLYFTIFCMALQNRPPRSKNSYRPPKIIAAQKQISADKGKLEKDGSPLTKEKSVGASKAQS